VSRTVYRAVIGTVPEPELSPNARTHRMVRARKQRELREFTHWSVRETAPESPLTGRVTVTVTIGWPKRRPGMDIDNATACLKGAIDGVVDAGYLVDDKQIAELRVRQRPWKEWGELGGWQYPHGCMVFDIEGQEHDDAG